MANPQPEDGHVDIGKYCGLLFARLMDGIKK
jgi:hypothetical protein